MEATPVAGAPPCSFSFPNFGPAIPHYPLNILSKILKNILPSIFSCLHLEAWSELLSPLMEAEALLMQALVFQ